MGSSLKSITLGKGLLGCNSVILLIWITLRTCFTECDSNAIKGFDFPHWTPIDFQKR